MILLLFDIAVSAGSYGLIPTDRTEDFVELQVLVVQVLVLGMVRESLQTPV